MKSFLRRILTIIAVILMALVLMIPYLRRRATTFSVSYPEKLTRIEFRSDTTRVVLKKRKGRWLINGQFQAREKAMKYLFYALKNLDIKSSVSDKTLIRILADSSSRKVSVKCLRGPLTVRSFQYILPTKDSQENIILKPGSEQYFTGYIPGEEDVSGLPFIPDPYYWRSHEVFHFLPGEVEKVTLLHLRQPESSFETGIDTSGNFFFNLISGKIPADTIIDTSRIARYLTYFQSFSFDDFAWQLSPEKKDEILKQQGLYELCIIAKPADTIRIRTIPKRISHGGITNDSVTFDTDLTWSWISPPGELVILKYYRIDPWLKEPSYFYTGKK